MPQSATLDLRHTDDGVLQVRLAGDWRLAGTLPSAEDALDRIRNEPHSHVVFDTGDLGDWDTALLMTLPWMDVRRTELVAEMLPPELMRLRSDTILTLVAEITGTLSSRRTGVPCSVAK